MKRIAILGGGIAGLAAALELTQHDGWRDLYEVTIYQLGWRLGGKCATGRGANGRIEEHGIHIMQGWYHNMVRLMTQVYAERSRYNLAPGNPFPTFHDALAPLHGTVLTDYCESLGGFVASGLNFPHREPPVGPPTELTPWHGMQKLLALGAHLSLGLLYEDQQGWLPKLHRQLLQWARIEDKLRGVLRVAAALQVGDVAAFRGLHALLRTGYTALDTVIPRSIGEHTRLHRMLAQIELVCILLKGLLDEVYDEATQRFDFASINQLDYRQWLSGLGASKRVLDCSLVRFSYAGMFANLADGKGQGGLVAAGAALRVLLLAVGYRGAWVSTFRAGTGDTVIMPIYDVLKHRGVRFKFFHDVKKIHHSASGVIERVDIDQQVTLKGDEYDPAIEVRSVRAWPNAPRYEQLDDTQAKRLLANEIDLESPWADWPAAAHSTLQRGRDFDQLILGIPVAALPPICAELIAHDDRWRRMVEGLKTTQTLAVQLWTTPTMKEMGMTPERFGLLPNTVVSTVVYAAPLISWVDMSSVLSAEGWDKGCRPGGLAYLSGAIEDAEPTPPSTDHGFPAREHERWLRATQEWLRHNLGMFWPTATSREYPRGIDLGHLYMDNDPGNAGLSRLRRQFLRSNAEPSSRYTLSVPGTDQLRLRADESGYENLFLAGDWTDFGVNVGYVEGAIISGLRAAQAVRRTYGCRVHSEIYVDVELAPRKAAATPAPREAPSAAPGQPTPPTSGR